MAASALRWSCFRNTSLIVPCEIPRRPPPLSTHHGGGRIALGIYVEGLTVTLPLRLLLFARCRSSDNLFVRWLMPMWLVRWLTSEFIGKMAATVPVPAKLVTLSSIIGESLD